ncbi:cytochrome P450 [Streptomyces indonesiensis]
MTNLQDPQDIPDPQNAPDDTGSVVPPPTCPAHRGASPLYGRQFLRNPTESYQRMRHDHGQVAPVLLEADIPAWLVLGYREMRQVLGDTQTYGRDPRRWNRWNEVPPDWSLMPWVAYSPMIHFTEGDEHRHRSAAVSDALSTVDPFELRAHCERFADGLIDQFACSGKADLVFDYVYSVPALAIGMMFGLPQDQLQDMAHALTASLDASGDAIPAQQRAAEIVTRLVTAKRDTPGPDITTRFIQTSPNLTDEQLVGDIMVMMVAGFPATSYWIGSTIRLMLTDTRFAVTLAGGRRSIGEAMTEVLWADSPSPTPSDASPFGTPCSQASASAPVTSSSSASPPQTWTHCCGPTPPRASPGTTRISPSPAATTDAPPAHPNSPESSPRQRSKYCSTEFQISPWPSSPKNSSGLTPCGAEPHPASPSPSPPHTPTRTRCVAPARW